jgi:DnaJ like chaperone protein
MRWTGKIVGGVIGLMTLGPVGAALGAILGHQFDEKSRDPQPAGGAGGAAIEGDKFFRATFEVMGHLAKADGRVSEDEIRAARGIMAELRLDETQVREAIAHFTRGKAGQYDLDGTIAALRRAYAIHPGLLGVFVEIQMRVQLAATDLRGPARAILQRIGAGLGVSGLELARMEAILRIRAQSRRSAGASGSPALELAEAYEVLEVEPSASDEELARAYRRQLSRHHPDKLKANGLPDSMLEHAKQRTQQIIEAWELLRERRGIR